MSTSWKTKLAAVVAAALATTLAGTATASGAQAAPSRTQAQLPPTGWKMVVHQVSSSYLFPDNYLDHEGQAVQSWNGGLVQDQGYKWLITQDGDRPGTYRIRSNPNRRCLTSGSTATDYVRMKTCTGSTSQSWYIRHVPGTTDDWAIVPFGYDDHALRPTPPTSTDAYVLPGRMWGGEPDLTHAWRLVDPPRGR